MKHVKALLYSLFALATTFGVTHPGIARDIKEKSHEYSSIIQSIVENNTAHHGVIVKEIVVQGNNLINPTIIKNSIPFKEGQPFDAKESAAAIDNLYNLGHFRQIKIEAEELSEEEIKLYIIVEEKKVLEKLTITGNVAISTKKIQEKFKTDKISTIDEESLRQLAVGIEKMYADEHRHFVGIETSIEQNKESTHKATATISITEGPKTLVKYVKFKGNKLLSERKLRSQIFTRENWLFSFTDGAGSYNKEALEIDRHRIEYLYRDNGYLTAKVTTTNVDFSPNKEHVTVTFNIKEGAQFNLRNIYAPGDEIFSEEELLPKISIKTDAPYSQSKLLESMNRLKDMWGEKGYIYTNVYPQVKPDETTSAVDVTFLVDKGNKLYVNKINITGNTITKDKVIRRQLEVLEGDLITTRKLERSKASVEYLSFFERDGIAWKIHRLSNELADLELNVKEAKTGQFNLQFNYGSDVYSSERSLKGALQLSKRNLFGNGWDVGGQVEANRHRLKRIEFNFFDPHLFDSNVSGGFNFYKRWDEFDQWRNVDKVPVQKITGGNVRFGVGLPWVDKNLNVIFDLGVERIKNNQPKANSSDQLMQDIFAPIVARTFQQGTLNWIGVDLIKDTRNHQIYPNSGYKLTLATRLAPPSTNEQFSFLKTELQGSCYTSLIGTDSLVLGMQLKLGHVESINNKIIPYKELFQMGGQTTVRGFVWGGIGPAWITGDPLGSKNAAQFNTELIFPLIEDYSMKGHVFYDTGAGWHTPRENIAHPEYIRRDSFDLRHSVGFGLNLVKPFPAKIDWGFKLDRKRDRGETPSEFHLSMNYAW